MFYIADGIGQSLIGAIAIDFPNTIYLFICKIMDMIFVDEQTSNIIGGTVSREINL